jgi:hypothetical protein
VDNTPEVDPMDKAGEAAREREGTGLEWVYRLAEEGFDSDNGGILLDRPEGYNGICAGEAGIVALGLVGDKGLAEELLNDGEEARGRLYGSYRS